jgi:hypothetical protein
MPTFALSKINACSSRAAASAASVRLRASMSSTIHRAALHVARLDHGAGHMGPEIAVVAAAQAQFGAVGLAAVHHRVGYRGK